MKEVNTISIANAGNDVDIGRIDTELKSLILTTEGTIPGSRGFGLAGEFLSMIPNEAANVLAIELEEKVETYIPEITIANVENCSTDPMEKMDVKIHVERRDMS
ncbi:hypothetical protein OCV99_03645 [Dorea acetigenes]|uniref:IraD/Gp25-like domain-containing protein n=1 Tax=Dorea acetigenes TaxID=2981787 RepID=A0ABT2RJT0_9FIRM|nr:hypothetical protein [Dorea acetigenes]MCU6685659.1 hypothetical protein [Dorea acetigenes]SCI58704.1 Uncharacterised protein [uncultured Clostridium sp.]